MHLAYRLGRLHYQAICTHLLALPEDDRWLRFGHHIDDAGVVRYAAQLPGADDALFGIFDPEHELAALAHLSFSHQSAELGLSVLPPLRRGGMGLALLARARTHAQARGMSRLFMHCIASNAPMQRLARQAGMSVESDHGESEAWLALPASPGALLADWMEDQMARADLSFKAMTQPASGLLEHLA